jgi:hypothetical protein
MAISFKHAFTSAKADGVDSTLVQPSNWNAEHTLTLAAGKVLGRNTSSAGAAQELPLAFDTAGNAALSATGSFTTAVGTTGERPGTPVTGMFRFNSSTTSFEGYNGTAWGSIGGGATGGNMDQIFYQNGQTVTTNYTITAGQNAGTFGPVTVNSGVTVTVPTGSTWSIV